MATSASLIVKISADINDFSKQLTSMTRQVDRAARELGEVGKKLTEAVAVPAALAAVEFAKLAGEQEEIAGRMKRVFGDMADSMDASITEMMKSTPATRTEFAKMAVSIDNLLVGMEIAPARAAKMSESVIKLAADVAAFNRVPMDEALSALEHGLAGKTKALLQYGIAITPIDIKQKALAMGLLHEGMALTEAGTAQAAYALLMEKTGRMQGEAARTAGEAGKSFAFLKAAMTELAESIGTLVLPQLASLVTKLKDFVTYLSSLSPTTMKVIVDLVALAGAFGVVEWVGTKVIAMVNKLWTAMKLIATTMMEWEAFSGIVVAIGEAIGAVVVTLGAPFVALAALIVATFVGIGITIQHGINAAKEATLASAKAALNRDPQLEKVVAGWSKPAGAAAATGGATEFDPLSVSARITKDAGALRAQYEDAIALGQDLAKPFADVVALNQRALAVYNAENDKLDEVATAARRVVVETNKIMAEHALGNAAAITEQFANAIALGQDLTKPFADIVALNQRALAIYTAQADKMSEVARAAAKVAAETSKIVHTQAVSDAIIGGAVRASTVRPQLSDALTAGPGQMFSGAIAALVNIFRTATAAPSQDVLHARTEISNASTAAVDDEALKGLAASAAIASETQLRLREVTVNTVDTFDALRVASLELKEKFRVVAQDFAKGLASFKQQWSDPGAGVQAGLQEGLTTAMAGLTPMGLAALAVSKVMQGLQPVIDDLMGPLVALGQIIGEELTPILKPMFQSLKEFGIATAFTAEVVYTILAGLAHVVGGIIVGIGKLISHIPFLGGVGKDIQDFGNNILDMGKGFSATAKELDQSRIQLQNLNFADAANGLQSVAGSATAAAESLTNLPQAFKIQLARFQATQGVNWAPPTPPPPTTPTPAPTHPAGSGNAGTTGGTGTDGGAPDPNQLKPDSSLAPAGATAAVYLDGKAVGQIVWNRIVTTAKKQYGSALRVADVAVVG